MHPHVQQPARPSKWCTWYLRLPDWKVAKFWCDGKLEYMASGGEDFVEQTPNGFVEVRGQRVLLLKQLDTVAIFDDDGGMNFLEIA